MVSVLPRGMLLGFIPFKSCMTAESEEEKKDYVSVLMRMCSLSFALKSQWDMSFWAW